MKVSSPPPLITIVIPVYNESDHLLNFIEDLNVFCEKHNFLAIFVNDGSTDNSNEILDELIDRNRTNLVHHPINRGYGGALKSGIQAAETPYIVTFDADGQHNLLDILSILELAQKNDADLIIGSRVNSRSSFRNLGKRLIRFFAKQLMPLTIQDLNSGFKLYKTHLAKKYSVLCPDGMAFSDVITLIFISQHNQVVEYPITINPRLHGKSTVNINTAFDTVLQILNIVMMFNPLRIFLPPSIFLIFLGILWAIPIIIAGRGVSVAALLSITAGLIFFAIGLIASQLSSIRLQLISNNSSSDLFLH